MKINKEISSSVLKSIQINMITLQIILKKSMFPTLRSTLESQLHELESLSTELSITASHHGWDLDDITPASRHIHCMHTYLQLFFRTATPQLASYMIQRNTDAINAVLSAAENISTANFYTRILIQKVLDCETAYIRRLKCFL